MCIVLCLQFMATVHQYGPPSNTNPAGRRVMYVKGAPDRLFPLCCSQLADDNLETINGTQSLVAFQEGFWVQAQEQLSSQGLRVLALCRWGLKLGARCSLIHGGGAAQASDNTHNAAVAVAFCCCLRGIPNQPCADYLCALTVYAAPVGLRCQVMRT